MKLGELRAALLEASDLSDNTELHVYSFGGEHYYGAVLDVEVFPDGDGSYLSISCGDEDDDEYLAWVARGKP